MATKTVPAERIKIALQAGHTLIVENKVQELKDKFEALATIIKYGVTSLKSPGRLDLAKKLYQRLSFENKTMDVFNPG